MVTSLSDRCEKRGVKADWTGPHHLTGDREKGKPRSTSNPWGLALSLSSFLPSCGRLSPRRVPHMTAQIELCAAAPVAASGEDDGQLIELLAPYPPLADEWMALYAALGDRVTSLRV